MKKAGNDPRAGVQRKTIAPSTHFRDAFLEALEAELGIAQFVACVLAQLSCLGRGSGQVLFEFSDPRAHLLRFILTQRLYPAPPAHPRTRSTPKACRSHGSKTLTSAKREHSKFNES
ncbi:hypothetical protein [Mesorhizobium sp. B3-2-1]|uniref:hypothetical protein n=1 Tax=Mesorhizobium sp. B3-2-1 TaxID=2589891 RepID=UPI0015E340A1|nr:hypothetical protein [Mesorhizobium sp. B3-2-1]